MEKTDEQRSLRGARGDHASILALIGAIQVVHSDDEASALLARLAAPVRPTLVSFVNHHALNLARSRPAFATLLAGSDLLLRDGVGVEVGMALLGWRPGLNMHGTDFIPRLAARYRGRRVALYGTAEPWVGRAAAVLAGMGCEMVSVRDGFRPIDSYVRAAAKDAPELVILAMGMPKQEQVAAAIAAAVAAPMVIVNGGAVADFLAERFGRAPVWVQNARLEWAFRMMREPRRLWRRYIVGGVVFAWSLLQFSLAHRAPPSAARIGTP